ncbi:4'-phosphopantetheinyl transferase family protein [Tomitella fengzijianii]|uniref:4'-phosphopantetheinyl transferase superfamily protein n=1 Tax=Tomitella fengzijianii TaxID=2597660 RepID=A0A516X3M7_9ACTN|nr:4'-phosphopantetheinyl transferase superfamily protein [Tomitella fengzijianii]QDQ97664.1 4'-phosphopantetheinyl transferase superfamily protein [Tomitella fengzijianii]
MIEAILPGGVEAAELFTDPPGITLFPEEQQQISRAVERRRAEYASVRHCARTAMGRLGVEPVALPKGDKGAPRWPRGIVGSMTHTAGYRAAAVGFALGVRSVGIDAEQNGPLPDGVLASVSLAAERDRIARDGAAVPQVRLDRLLFSAKEATYKAWYPLTRRWLGFEDADITVTADAPADGAGGDDGAVTGTFRSRILVPGHTVDGSRLETLDGRWIAAHGLVVTAIVVM